MNGVGKSWRDHLLTAFSGDADGVPQWIAALEHGGDEGYFGPGSAVWQVHGATPVIVAGIRALLLQTLHPGAMAGVYDWSRYREDPLGRLSGTVRWVLVTRFADTAGADAVSASMRTLHTKVAGSYGDGAAYSAAPGGQPSPWLGWPSRCSLFCSAAPRTPRSLPARGSRDWVRCARDGCDRTNCAGTMRILFAVLRLAVAIAIIAAIAGQLHASLGYLSELGGVDLPTHVAHFFSFFTIESNVLSAVVLLIGAWFLLFRRGPDPA